MKISTKTWHFRVFNMWEQASGSFYNNHSKPVTDCKYVAKIMLNSLLVLLLAIIFIPIIIFALGMILEPFFVLGNYFLSGVIEPIIGTLGFWDKEGEPSLGPFYAGCFIWLLALLVAAIIFVRRSKEKHEDFWENVSEKTHESFAGILWERFKSWKGKYCHTVEFIED